MRAGRVIKGNEKLPFQFAHPLHTEGMVRTVKKSQHRSTTKYKPADSTVGASTMPATRKPTATASIEDDSRVYFWRPKDDHGWAGQWYAEPFKGPANWEVSSGAYCLPDEATYSDASCTDQVVSG